MNTNQKFRIQVIGKLWNGGQGAAEKLVDVEPVVITPTFIGITFGDFQSIRDYQIIKVDREVKQLDAKTTQYIRTETITSQWGFDESEEIFADTTQYWD